MRTAGLILLGEDDPDDRVLLEHAFHATGSARTLVFVDDGEDLMDFLTARGRHVGARSPDLVLLDLNMPRKDGWEALTEMRADPLLRRIPVVVLTTSNAAHDVRRAYELGANSFVTKPVNFDALVRVVRTIDAYWFGTVALPTTG